MPTTAPALLFRLLRDGFILGLVFAAAYDILRILRIAFDVRRQPTLPLPPGRRARCPSYRLRDLGCNLADLLYCVVGGAVIAVYLSTVNDGRFRWPLAVGIMVGFGLWRLTAGRLLLALSAAIAALLHAALAWTFWLMSRPIVFIGRKFACFALALWRRAYLPHYTRIAMRRCLFRLATAFTETEKEG